MKTDMSASPSVDRAPSLRDAHKALTRTRIEDAAIALMEAEDPDALTLARVAAAAGVTERTLYRHFATRDALVAAVWARVSTSLVRVDEADTKETLVGHPRRLFAAFDGQAPLVRALVHTREGRELRMEGNGRRRARIVKAVREARPDLDGAARTRLAAVVQLLDSAYAWAAMQEYWDMDGETAGLAASEALACLLTPPGPTRTPKERRR